MKKAMIIAVMIALAFTACKDHGDPSTLTGITAVYTGTTPVYPMTPHNNLKADLTVTAKYDDGASKTLNASDYTLSGTLTVGESVVTVTYLKKTDTFNVTVSESHIAAGCDCNGYNSECDCGAECTCIPCYTITSENCECDGDIQDCECGDCDCPVCETVPASVNTHSHQWGAWTATATEGTDERSCAIEPSHKQTRLTGTTRFAFTAVGDPVTGYIVRKQSGTTYTGAVTIPDFYRPSGSASEDDFKPITAIGADGDAFANWAFYGLSNITAINIPESVTAIGTNAFQNCSNITSITLPASLKSISNNAFSNASGLATVTIAEGSQLESIGDTAFGSTAITAIVIPASVTYLGTSAFRTCNNLATVTFAAGSHLTLINNSSFSACRSLVSIEIPASVTTIGNSAFAGSTTSSAPSPATALTTVTFAAGSKLTTIENYAFRFNANLATVNFAAGTKLTSVGTMVFNGCTNETELEAVMAQYKQ